MIGELTEQRTPAESTPYHVGTEGLALYPEPKAANATARLKLHQKIVRTKLEGGWAFVTVAGTGQKGWVDNAKLIWRLPEKTAPRPKTAKKPQPEPVSPSPGSHTPPSTQPVDVPALRADPSVLDSF